MRSDSRARRSDRRSVCRDSAVRAADPNGNVSRMCVSAGSARGALAGADVRADEKPYVNPLAPKTPDSSAISSTAKT